MTYHTMLAVVLCLTISGCFKNSFSASEQVQGNASAQSARNETVPRIIEGNTLRFIAGEFRAQWTAPKDKEMDKQSHIEDRFPFVTEGKLQFIEIGNTQRVSVVNLSDLVNILNNGGFLSEEIVYPSCETDQNCPKILAMYQGGVVLEYNNSEVSFFDKSDEADEKEQSLKQLPLFQDKAEAVKTTAPTRDYLKSQEKEWLVYPNRVDMRDNTNESKTVFQCEKNDNKDNNCVFNLDYQNGTLAVEYKNLDNESTICVWKEDNGTRNYRCQNALVVNKATNPVLSPDSRYLAVATTASEGRWDLKVGPVKDFSNQSVVREDVKFYDIGNKTVFYRNSYAWGGNTLVFGKREEPLNLYKITCQEDACGDSQPFDLPEKGIITVCKPQALVYKHQQQNSSSELITSYIKDTLKWKNNRPLWFKVADDCRYKLGDNEKEKPGEYQYKMASIKWGQPFFVDVPYLAVESRLKFVGKGGRWITRILVFAID